MIYGNKFLPPKYKTSSDSFTLESMSVAYNEYTNRLSLLESCTNEDERSILEAQVQVLYEVGIQDIFGKLIDVWNKFKEWVKRVFNNIKESLGKLAEKIRSAIDTKYKTAKALYKELKEDKEWDEQEIVDNIVDEIEHNFVIVLYGFNNDKNETLRPGELDKIIPIYTKGLAFLKRIGDFSHLDAESMENEAEEIKNGSEKFYNITESYAIRMKRIDPSQKENLSTVLNVRINNNMSVDKILDAFEQMNHNASLLFKKDILAIGAFEQVVQKKINEHDADISRFKSQWISKISNTLDALDNKNIRSGGDTSKAFKNVIEIFNTSRVLLQGAVDLVQFNVRCISSMQTMYAKDISALLSLFESKKRDIDRVYGNDIDNLNRKYHFDKYEKKHELPEGFEPFQFEKFKYDRLTRSKLINKGGYYNDIRE